jgi:ABC-type polysaccharide/polyol phosphate transport system ATPase subunit
MAGILRPDEGSIRTFGRRSTLLTLGAGFDNDLTGRENIYLNGSFLGLSHKTMREEFDEIVNFAELGGFVDVPLRKYSAGMRSRLAFAIAVHIQPDLLLLDEVLGVGDIAFLEKSRRKLEELMQESHAIVAVTHNLEFLKRTCTTMLWLHEGRSVAFGDPDTVIERYVMAMRGIVDPVRNIV